MVAGEVGITPNGLGSPISAINQEIRKCPMAFHTGSLMEQFSQLK